MLNWDYCPISTHSLSEDAPRWRLFGHCDYTVSYARGRQVQFAYACIEDISRAYVILVPSPGGTDVRFWSILRKVLVKKCLRECSQSRNIGGQSLLAICNCDMIDWPTTACLPHFSRAYLAACGYLDIPLSLASISCWQLTQLCDRRGPFVIQEIDHHEPLHRTTNPNDDITSHPLFLAQLTTSDS
ncbi:hypothetical protein BDZ91DRAFT_167196 [Kalaharituber pfeilii]|nr:hypothetical protein BDZ91DRAFT_167196 [Kalaharituber pfeilii]